jgi:hypothetical protein
MWRRLERSILELLKKIKEKYEKQNKAYAGLELSEDEMPILNILTK